MHIWRISLIPATVYDAGIPLTKNRVYTVGQDQVAAITQGTNGDFTVSLEDDVDEGVTIVRDIIVPWPQVRTVNRSDEGE